MTTRRIQSLGELLALGSFWVLASLVAWGAPPVIVKRPETVRFQSGTTVVMRVTAESALPMSYQWFRNREPIAGATQPSLVFAESGVEHVGDYSVEVSNADGTVSSLPDDDVRAMMSGAFVVEAEDFNFGGGKTLEAANVMPNPGGLFQGMDGLPGIDFHLVSQSTTNALEFGSAYRNGWAEGGVVRGEPPTAPEPLGNVDIYEDAAADAVRPDYRLERNFRLSGIKAGEWFQYTRNGFGRSAGIYSAAAIMSSRSGRTDRFAAVLEVVTGDPASTNAETIVVGEIAGAASAVGGNYDYWPFRPVGSQKQIDGASFLLDANFTLRFRVTEGECDLDALLLYREILSGVICLEGECPLVFYSPTVWKDFAIDYPSGTIRAVIPESPGFGFIGFDPRLLVESFRLEGEVFTVGFRVR